MATGFDTSISHLGSAVQSGCADSAKYLLRVLRELLASHRRRVPTRLPSERSLASALHVSRGTVASAYEILPERGILERDRGSGSVARPRAHEVSSDPIACVREFFART